MPVTHVTFTGFATPNTTPVPDQLFDELLTVLSGNEIKVLLYIIRRTFGFKKQRDTISLNQMLSGIQRKDGTVLDKGVGISKPTLLNALRALVSKGIVIRERRTDTKRGNLPTCYALRLAEAKNENVKPIPQKKHRVEERQAAPLGQKSLPRIGQKPLPTTRNSLTKDVINVVQKHTGSGKSSKPIAQVDYLVDEIERHTGDTHSRGNFAQIASVLPDHRVFQLLAEMRQNSTLNNKGAWFTAQAKRQCSPKSTGTDTLHELRRHQCKQNEHIP